MFEINLWAVLVAGATGFAVGGVWYAVLFRKPWMAMMGMTEESAAQMSGASTARSYGIQFVGLLVMAFAFAHILAASLVAYPETTGITAGLAVGFWA
jgi:hypothetical protein